MEKNNPQSTRLAAILEALEDMAAGELDRRAPISPEHDEIDAIAYTANVLVGELRWTLDRLALTEKDAHQANKQKDLLLRSVSHELGTPLAAMLSSIDVLSRNALDDKQRNAVRRIRANGEALQHLIDDLLDVGRIEAGTLQLSLEPVSPVDVASDVVQSLLPAAQDKNLTLRVSIAPGLPAAIVTDARRLRQVLRNLVGNAVKFTDSGEVVVSLGIDASANKLIIDISDAGIGLSETDGQPLLSPFAPTEHGGLAIGLILAKELSRKLGGELYLVSSQLSQDAHFRVQFDINQHVPPQPSLEPSPDKSSPDLHGLSVLVADDNDDLLSALAELLELSGCNVKTARDGIEAVECVSSCQFDIILMDMQMPTLDGLEAARRIRQTGFGGAIFAVSAHSTAEDRQLSLAAGCTDHIEKPIDMKNLATLLEPYRSPT